MKKHNDLFVRQIKGGNSSLPAIVVLHGLYSSSSNWYTMARKIAQETDASVFLVDLPNHGHSMWTEELSYSDVCGHIQGWILRQSFSNGIILLGHSFGARVAMVLASRLGPLVRGYVMMDMSPMVEVRSDRMVSLWHAMLLGRMVEASQMGVTNIAEYLTEHKIDNKVALSMAMPYRQMNITAAWNGVMGLCKEIRGIQDEQFWRQIAPIKMMVIRGGESYYVPQGTEELMAERFLDFRIETIANATHDVHYSSPDRLKELLIGFIRECSSTERLKEGRQ